MGMVSGARNSTDCSGLDRRIGRVSGDSCVGIRVWLGPDRWRRVARVLVVPDGKMERVPAGFGRGHPFLYYGYYVASSATGRSRDTDVADSVVLYRRGYLSSDCIDRTALSELGMVAGKRNRVDRPRRNSARWMAANQLLVRRPFSGNRSDRSRIFMVHVRLECPRCGAVGQGETGAPRCISVSRPQMTRMTQMGHICVICAISGYFELDGDQSS